MCHVLKCVFLVMQIGIRLACKFLSAPRSWYSMLML